VPGRSMAGRYVFPSLRRAVCAARPPFGPGSARSFAPSCVEGCWSPALDPHGFTVGYSAMRGRQLHCRKIQRCVRGGPFSLGRGLGVSLWRLSVALPARGRFRATKRATRWVALANLRWLCALSASAWPSVRGRRRGCGRPQWTRGRAARGSCGPCRTA